VDKWWFLDTGLSHGAKNMAIDEVLATRVVPKENVPVFRIYGWQPVAISLGYGQDPKKLDLHKCQLDGIDIVRRPTGGRAVFHAEEITYSVIIPKNSEFFSPDILSTYNLISKGLLAGLKLFGIDTQLVKRRVDEKKSATYKNDVPCFSFSAEYEIAYANKKLVGSAQRRYENSILQHGSILTGVRHLKLADYIVFSDEFSRKQFKEELTNKTISISQILKRKIDQKKLVESLKMGMQNSYNIEFHDRQLTPQELDEVNKVIETYLT
jgi:lipoyl(octanoyl) transferase